MNSCDTLTGLVWYISIGTSNWKVHGNFFYGVGSESKLVSVTLVDWMFFCVIPVMRVKLQNLILMELIFLFDIVGYKMEPHGLKHVVSTEDCSWRNRWYF